MADATNHQPVQSVLTSLFGSVNRVDLSTAKCPPARKNTDGHYHEAGVVSDHLKQLYVFRLGLMEDLDAADADGKRMAAEKYGNSEMPQISSPEELERILAETKIISDPIDHKQRYLNMITGLLYQQAVLEFPELASAGQGFSVDENWVLGWPSEKSTDPNAPAVLQMGPYGPRRITGMIPQILGSIMEQLSPDGFETTGFGSMNLGDIFGRKMH